MPVALGMGSHFLNDISLQDGASLRNCLRAATRDSHDRLDAEVSALDLASPQQYERFLAFQYAARLPVELWLTTHSGIYDLPPMTPLIARDLSELGAALPATENFGHDANTGAVGIAWALAGSHLGNRTLSVRLAKQGGAELPHTFLSDDRMLAAWRRLLPVLDMHHGQDETECAIAAANAVFAHFKQSLDAAGVSGKKLAA